MNEVQIRPVRRGGCRCARADPPGELPLLRRTGPEAFQVPTEDGLVKWFESWLDAPRCDELAVVAEVDGEVVGLLEARTEPPVASAGRQLTREL